MTKIIMSHGERFKVLYELWVWINYSSRYKKDDMVWTWSVINVTNFFVYNQSNYKDTDWVVPLQLVYWNITE